MANIITSKTRRSKSYLNGRRSESTGIRKEVAKEKDSDMLAWQAVPKGERTRICMDDMGKALKDEAISRGQEPKHDAIQSFVSKAAEKANSQ